MRKDLLPEGWSPPKGYANGIRVTGTEWLFLGGQIGWNSAQQFESDDFVDQVKQTLKNIIAVLSEADAGPEHMVRMTWYVTDKSAYVQSLKAMGQVYRQVVGKHYPAMSVIEVKSLVEDRAQVEIEVTAVK